MKKWKWLLVTAGLMILVPCFAVLFFRWEERKEDPLIRLEEEKGEIAKNYKLYGVIVRTDTGEETALSGQIQKQGNNDYVLEIKLEDSL